MKSTDPENLSSCGEDCDEPSFWDKLKGLASDMKNMAKRMLKDGEALVDEDTRNKRLYECMKCEFRDPNSDTVKCTKCGCYMKIKTWISSSECPINIWKATEIKRKGE